MSKKELLIIKKERDKMRFRVCDKETNKWSPNRYEKVIAGKDYNLLAFLFYDLNSMGYPIEKAFTRFKQLLNKPDLFFLE